MAEAPPLSRRAALAGLAGTMAAISLPARAIGPVLTPRIRLDPASRLVQGGWATGSLSTPGAVLTLGDTAVSVAGDGRFFLAFDRDCPAAILLRAAAPGAPAGVNDLATQQLLTIAPGQWQLEEIDAPFHPAGMGSEAFERIRATEIAAMDAARTHDTGAQGWRQGFIWPVAGRISGRFGAQRIYRGTPATYHSGLDIATGESGTPYVCPADGVVVLAADHPFTLEGNLLMVDHGMGLSSSFLHNSLLRVGVGDSVKQGQTIGQIGQTGRATGPHLHWSLRWKEARLDPLLFVGPMR